MISTSLQTDVFNAVTGNFLRPAPLRPHPCYPWSPGKTALQKATFSTDYGGGPRGLRGRWDSHPQTDRHMQSSVSEVFFLRKKPEMNLKARRSSPHKFEGACFLSEGAHTPHLWATWLGWVIPTCVVETEVTVSGTLGPGMIQASFLCPEDFHSKQTVMSICLSYSVLCEG